MRFVLCLVVLLAFTGASSAFRVRRQAEPSVESSGEESGSGIEDFSGTSGEISGETSGVSGETSGISGEESGEGSSEQTSSGEIEQGQSVGSSGEETSGQSGEFSGDESGEEGSAEGESLSGAEAVSIQATALTIQAQANTIALQSQTISNQLDILTQTAQELSKSAQTLVTDVSNAVLPTTSTPPLVDGGNNQTNSTCALDATCFSNSECGSGSCLGVFLGTCNCNACLNFVPCDNDSACGGLKGACSNATRTCDCFNGFAQNGFPNFFDALTNLCNVKQCNAANSSEACFGLPCNAGRCVC